MPRNGRSSAQAMPLAAVLPISSDEASPGPVVAAKASISPMPTPASASAFSTSPRRCSEWLREASSGTTPPCSRCSAICEEISEASTSVGWPGEPRTMATAVSSQEDSIARSSATGRFLVEARANTREKSAPRRWFSRLQDGSGPPWWPASDRIRMEILGNSAGSRKSAIPRSWAGSPSPPMPSPRCWRCGCGIRQRDRLWLFVALGMAALCVNKQLDLQSLFTDIGRVASHHLGWYEKRRAVSKMVRARSDRQRRRLRRLVRLAPPRVLDAAQAAVGGPDFPD